MRLIFINVIIFEVQQLQGSMRDILNCLTLFCNLPQENVKRLLTAGVAEALSTAPDSALHVSNSSTNDAIKTFSERRDSAATQTEIVAVHTPQLENQYNFPFNKIRPSTLPFIESQIPNTASNCESRNSTSNEPSDANIENVTKTPINFETTDIVVSIAEKKDENEKQKLNLTSG